MDSKGLSEMEFTMAMLVELGVVDWDNAFVFIKQFRKFDADASGFLTHKEVLCMYVCVCVCVCLCVCVCVCV